jgi:hypothetical protein
VKALGGQKTIKKSLNHPRLNLLIIIKKENSKKLLCLFKMHKTIKSICAKLTN